LTKVDSKQNALMPVLTTLLLQYCIYDSVGGEDFCCKFLGYDVMQFERWILTFRWNIYRLHEAVTYLNNDLTL
jgi:hypothetical protein